MDFDLSQVDLLWLETQQAFPAIYREALLTSTSSISIPDFKRLFIKRIKRSGLVVKSIQDNVILVNGKFIIWITLNPVGPERQPLKEYLHSEGIVRLGYILRLDDIPEWGCVQISMKYLKNNKEIPPLHV